MGKGNAAIEECFEKIRLYRQGLVELDQRLFVTADRHQHGSVVCQRTEIARPESQCRLRQPQGFRVSPLLAAQRAEKLQGGGIVRLLL